jgi:hypothetical protein
VALRPKPDYRHMNDQAPLPSARLEMAPDGDAPEGALTSADGRRTPFSGAGANVVLKTAVACCKTPGAALESSLPRRDYTCVSTSSGVRQLR